MTAPGKNTPQRRTALGRRIRSLLLLGLAATGLAALLASNWQLIVGTLEERAIAAERAKRRAMWALGQPLPGTPELARLDERLAASGFTLKQPILVRIFKREFELEIWKLKDQRFQLFATYPICRWSGRLGPKLETGDRQAPEGFYWVAANQLNPNSRWRRSFNLGFPNAYDRALGRSGSFLMVHGGCGSVGCYAMTDAVVDEIWRLVTSALAAGQDRFQVQAFPFRMSEDNMAAHRGEPNFEFWQQLKAGADLFEATATPPAVAVCKARYQFRTGPAGNDGSKPIAAACAAPEGRKSSPES